MSLLRIHFCKGAGTAYETRLKKCNGGFIYAKCWPSGLSDLEIFFLHTGIERLFWGHSQTHKRLFQMQSSDLLSFQIVKLGEPVPTMSLGWEGVRTQGRLSE
jgi:hypothetical protein